MFGSKNTNGQGVTETIVWLWYSAQCSYWTDDFDDLDKTESVDKAVGGIPCCPHCGMVGYQIELGDWNDGLAHYDREEPGYQDFIIELKKTCRGMGVSTTALWEDHKRHRDDKKDKE